MRWTKIAMIAAWAMIPAIVFMTLGPVGDRPGFGHPQLERFGAYLVLGAVLTVAYRPRIGWVAVGLVLGTIALEALQMVVPGRDAGMPDVIAKVLGGLCGVVLAGAAGMAAPRRRPFGQSRISR